MLGSFFVCAVITIAVPLGVNAYLQNATEFLSVIVQANQGTVSIDDGSDVPQAVRVGEPGGGAEPGATILTDATAVALMSIFMPNSEQLLARLYVYSNTSVVLEQSNTPRFSISDAKPTVQFDLAGGRMRLTVPEFEERPLQITITTPQGTIAIQEPGQYDLIADNEETQVTVQAGKAHVVAVGHYVDLNASQRSVIPTGEMPSVPLGIERNLIQNGDFGDGWNHWRQYAWDIERSDQPAGHINVESVNGEPTLYIIREGEGHAGVEVRQTINQDVTDAETLLFEVDFRIIGQTLAVCGSVGSECPLMVRIDYDDVNGNSQVWLRGFYTQGEGGAPGTPDVCETCPPPRLVHYKAVPDQVLSFETDLIEELKQQAFLPPRHIKSISLLASGHSFELEILRVAILVE